MSAGDRTKRSNSREKQRNSPDRKAADAAEPKWITRHKQSEAWTQLAEELLQELMQIEQDNEGTFYGTNALRNAAKRLKVSVRTITRMFHDYKEKPGPNAIRGTGSGRPHGRQIPEQQQGVIAYFYLNPEQKQLYADGSTAKIKRLSTIKFIRSVLEKKFQAEAASRDQVYRFLQDMKRDDPTTIDLARKGKRFVEEHLMPTKRNDVPRVGQRGQMDARILPIYILHLGKICTVSLLLLMDDKSRKILGWRLIPRIKLNKEGKPQRADFTRDDVAGVIIEAMVDHCMRLEGIYTDHGSQFCFLSDLLQDRSPSRDVLERFTRSIPGRPRGRGKIEELLKKFNEAVKGFRSFIENEKDRHAWETAYSSQEKPTLEKVEAEVANLVDKHNESPPRENGKRTCNQIWDATTQLPAPPVRRFLTLAASDDRYDDYHALTNWGIKFDDDEYEPRIDQESIEEAKHVMVHWLDAASRPEHCRLVGVKAHGSWRMEVCLNIQQDYWVECVQKEVQALTVSTERYAELRGHAMKDLKGRLSALRTKAEEATQTLGLEQIHRDAATGEAVIVDEKTPSDRTQSEQESQPAALIHPATSDSPKPKGGRKETQGDGANGQAVASSRWASMPDVRKLAEQLKQERGES